MVSIYRVSISRSRTVLQLKKGGVAKAKGEGEQEKECTVYRAQEPTATNPLQRVLKKKKKTRCSEAR